MGKAFLAFGVSLLLAAAAVAEDEVLRRQHGEKELLASWIIGSSVRGADNQEIGRVRTLVVDEESGRITALVVASGHVLGFGGKEVGLRWDQLRVERDGRDLSVDVSAEDAGEAPVFHFRERTIRPPESPSTEPQPASRLEGAR